jgi:hypothetical protein
MKITKLQLQSLIKESVKEVIYEQDKSKGVNIKGHKNLTIKDGTLFEELPQLIQDAKTENAVIQYDYYDNFDFIEGIWHEGIWEGGHWHDGTWKGGIWRSGEWEKGTWESGIWHSGNWNNGLWLGGDWLYGTWYDGLWKDGNWMNGNWINGIWESGVWHDGVWKDGTWESGIFHKGTHKNKPFYGFDEDGQMIFDKK